MGASETWLLASFVVRCGRIQIRKKIDPQLSLCESCRHICIPIAIAVLFYSYTAVLGEDLLVLDILTFILAVIIGQLASYKLLVYRELQGSLNQISLVALALLRLAFVLFTFCPPHLPMFRDPISGEYGIINHMHG